MYVIVRYILRTSRPIKTAQATAALLRLCSNSETVESFSFS